MVKARQGVSELDLVVSLATLMSDGPPQVQPIRRAGELGEERTEVGMCRSEM